MPEETCRQLAQLGCQIGGQVGAAIVTLAVGLTVAFGALAAWLARNARRARVEGDAAWEAAAEARAQAEYWRGMSERPGRLTPPERPAALSLEPHPYAVENGELVPMEGLRRALAQKAERDRLERQGPPSGAPSDPPWEPFELQKREPREPHDDES